MTEARTLLTQYVENGSETAFRELVGCYINLVYSTALRLVEGDSHRAEDVTQMVFVRLTKKAKSLTGEVSLGGWLHRDTCYVAATLMRSERRRQVRERQAVEMNTLQDDANLSAVLPVLDEAINELGSEDRDAIILRFFEQRNFRALGEMVGSSEDAARMRVNRALEKLHGLLKGRGVALSVGGLGAFLATKAIAAAPTGLAASVVSGVASGATVGSGGVVQAVARAIGKQWKLLVLPGAALLLTVSAGVYVANRVAERTSRAPVQQVAAVPQIPTASTNAAAVTEADRAARRRARPNAMTFRAVDAVSGAPLIGAKVRVASFLDSGEAKTTILETDSQGETQIEFIKPPYQAANVFVTSAGHVPMVVRSWHGDGDMPTNYVMKIQPGTRAAGVVVDESNQPVANVKIEFNDHGIDDSKRENVSFGPDTAQHTDASGHWSCDMVPADYDALYALLTHPDFAATSMSVSANTSSATNAVLVIKHGVTVAGIVSDKSGQPVVGAMVKQVHNRREPHLSAKSDATGRFEMAHVNSGELELLVQSEGFSPLDLNTVVSNSPVELKFELTAGHLLRGHVVGKSGRPISKASVQTRSTDNQGVQRMEWSAKADDEGKFEWNSAPAEPLDYVFSAKGYSEAVLEFKADGTEHEIVMSLLDEDPGNSKFKISGTAVDADTGEPLDEFKVLGASTINPYFPPRFSFATDGRDGKFELHRRIRFMTGSYQIQIQKDGYAPVVSTNLSMKDGDLALKFELHEDLGLHGVVFLSNGDPAASATVFLYDRQGGVYMDQPGGFRKDAVTTAKRVTADDQGRFFFPTVFQTCGFIAIHDQGYADAPLATFSGKIVLQAWGRVEGKLTVGGHPGAGQKVTLGDVLYRYQSTRDRMFSPLQLWLEATTDDGGIFVFEKVPSGERKVAQRLTSPKAGPELIYDTQGQVIEVAAGTVTHVELGGSGRTISGKAVFSGLESVKWCEVHVTISLKSAEPERQRPNPKDFSSTEEFMNAARAYSEEDRAFWTSEKGRELERSQRSYTAYCAADGSFSVPDVPVGKYHLRIGITQPSRGMNSGPFNEREVGVVDMDIDVPANAEREALNLGTLELQAVRTEQQGG